MSTIEKQFGISREGDLVDLAAECDVVEKSGAWFGFEGERIGQGRENARLYLREHPDVTKKIESKLLAHHGVKREVGPPALSAGPVAGGPAGTVRPMAPQPKAQAPDKRR